MESKIGVGSTFTVTIPCRIASKDEAQVKQDTTMTAQCHGRIKKGCAGDYDSYPKLERSLKEENVEEAFRAAHTLKGVCQNLGFTNLYQPTYELTEVLRAGTLEGSKEWFDRVTEQYNITIDAIRAVQ